MDLAVRHATCRGAGIPPGCLIFSFALSGGLAALDTPANFGDRSAVGIRPHIDETSSNSRLEMWVKTKLKLVADRVPAKAGKRVSSDQSANA